MCKNCAHFLETVHSQNATIILNVIVTATTVKNAEEQLPSENQITISLQRYARNNALTPLARPWAVANGRRPEGGDRGVLQYSRASVERV